MTVFSIGVRAMLSFAQDTGLIEKCPNLKRVKNEVVSMTGSRKKPMYNPRLFHKHL